MPTTVLSPEKVRFARLTQFMYSLTDVLCLCQYDWGPSFHLYAPHQFVDVVHAVTGWDIDLAELMIVGERRINMQRAFNAREGFDRKQDRLPDRVFQTALKGGSSDGVVYRREAWEAAISEYYSQMGWDAETGNPTAETLNWLGLDWITAS